jgi:hypothetical protein
MHPKRIGKMQLYLIVRRKFREKASRPFDGKIMIFAWVHFVKLDFLVDLRTPCDAFRRIDIEQNVERDAEKAAILGKSSISG